MNSGHQRQLPAPGQHGGLVGVADEPLVGGDDLQRAGAVLPELDRVADGPGLALHVAGLGQQLDDPRLGLLDGLARQLVVVALGGGRIGGLPPRLAPRDRAQPAVPLDDRADAAGPARATRSRRWCRRTCRSWRRRCPSRGRPARGPRSGPRRRTAAWWRCARTGRGSARRRGGRRGRRRPAAARAGWCRSTGPRRRGRGSAACGRRRGCRGPPARPGRRRCGSRRPTAWATRTGRPGPGGAGAGTPAGWPGWPRARWCGSCGPSRPTGRCPTTGRSRSPPAARPPRRTARRSWAG